MKKKEKIQRINLPGCTNKSPQTTTDDKLNFTRHYLNSIQTFLANVFVYREKFTPKLNANRINIRRCPFVIKTSWIYFSVANRKLTRQLLNVPVFFFVFSEYFFSKLD